MEWVLPGWKRQLVACNLCGLDSIHESGDKPITCSQVG